METASIDETSAAIEKYSTFVQQVLEPQLKESLKQRDALSTEITEYEELQEFVAAQLDAPEQTSLHLLMDIGQRFHVRAKISDPSMITVDIGLNFHVEMTLQEAQVFVLNHLIHLAKKRETWQIKAREVSDHVNMVLEAIQKLAVLQQASNTTT